MIRSSPGEWETVSQEIPRQISPLHETSRRRDEPVLSETLVSDHDIIQLEIEMTNDLPKQARLTDWNAFRNELDSDDAHQSFGYRPTVHRSNAT